MKSEELAALEAGLGKYPLAPVDVVRRLIAEVRRLQEELEKRAK